MQILEEQKIPFSTQIQDVTKGINRIRYLKQKINNTYCLLKGINAVDDDGVSKSYESALSNDDKKGEYRGLTSQLSNRRGLRTVQSQRRYINLPKGQNLHQNISTYIKNKPLQKQSIIINKKKWNDNFFLLPQQKSTRQKTRQSASTSNIDSFYHNLLIKNLSSKSQLQSMTLTELKKVNYNTLKKQRQQRKLKIQQQKENRFRQMMKKREKVQLEQKLGEKKIFLFMKEKHEDLKSIKEEEKSKVFNKMNQKIKEQLKLEQLQKQRLAKIQKSLLLKENLKKIIETKITQHKNYNLQEADIQHQAQMESKIEIFDQ